MPRSDFRQIERTVTQEYIDKGYSPARADHIGRAVAGRQSRRRWAKQGVPADVKRQRACVRRGLRAATFENPRQWQRTFGEVTQHCAEQLRKPQRRGRAR